MKNIKLFLIGLFLTCGILVGLKELGIDSNQSIKSKASAATVWYEQTFSEMFWGNGLFQLRRKFTATKRTPNTSVIHENGRNLVSVDNRGKNVTVKKKYTETIRVGHNVSTRLKGKAKHFEAELGYSFSYEKVTTEETEITIHPYESADVWEYDKRINYTYVDVKVQKQKASFTGWKNDGSYWWEDEVVRKYDGNHIVIK